MNTIVVTAAVIIAGDKVLITQRLASGAQSLKWEFPGGKLLPGEQPAQGLRREIKEELDLEIEVKNIYEAVSHCYRPDQRILLIVYLCRPLGESIRPLQCADYRWVTQVELGGYDFSAADIPVVKKIQNDFPRLEKE